MTDTIEVPQFTTEQKLMIRESQVQALQAKDQARQLVDKANQIENQVIQFINKTASDLSIDPKLFVFDANTLTFHKATE